MPTEATGRRVLLIGYHYPPVSGSSGVQRILKFSRYLPEFGWQPSVLTVIPSAYQATNAELLAEIPAGVKVRRAFAFDTARRLSVLGRYPQFLALPDRWASWFLGALPAGLALIRRERIEAIWSTFPIASAHLIGYALARLSGRPWIADFRDPMLEDEYPTEPARRRMLGWLERKIMTHASAAVFTTSGMLEYYEQRYATRPKVTTVIENGYDEENFLDAESGGSALAPKRDARLTLVHSGTLYPEVRDPRTLFTALAHLKDKGAVNGQTLRIVLRATGYDDFVRAQIQEFGLEEIVEIAPALGYRAALAEMIAADALLILQASNSNYQIPAKLYEYLRAGRPIFALTDPRGDSGATLRKVGIDAIVPMDQQDAVTQGLAAFLERMRAGTAPGCSRENAMFFSRRAQSGRLATLLNDITRGAASTAEDARGVVG
jgi:glycosyltransferase involved in cell wall biosynthesis